MFKNKFKYYKSRSPYPTFENVIDFQSGNLLSEKVIMRQPCIAHQYSNLGLTELSTWRVFDFKDKLGLIFIVNPFTSSGQRYWVEKCLRDYTRKPNKLNLDPFNELQPGEDWWETTQSNDKERAQRVREKLRWATLGYHHNWDTKEYSDAAHTVFPPDLAELSKVVVQALDDSAISSYNAEAAIVNFYHLDSTLSGHKDVSEPNMNAPLLSISFGQSAVFLVGGDNLNDPVTAMFLHSGDIVVMSGPARHWYHGVPRVVQVNDKPWAGDNWELTCYGEYMETSRININVRQVLKPGQSSIKL